MRRTETCGGCGAKARDTIQAVAMNSDEDGYEVITVGVCFDCDPYEVQRAWTDE